MENKLSTITLILLLLFSSLTFLAPMPTVKANPDWLSGWSYRKLHVINNATGAGTNYQVQIIVINGTGTDSENTVYINNKTRSDFGDVRFTKSDGVTLLDYWIETVNAGVNATFWVEVADDLSVNPAAIYVYYGKSDAASASNGEATFEVFLDSEAYDAGTVNPDFWSEMDYYFDYDTATREVSVGVSSSIAYTGTKSYRMYIRSYNNYQYHGRTGVVNLYKAAAEKNVCFVGRIYVASVSSFSYGATAGFIAAFNVSGTWKAIYYRFAYAASDTMPYYYVGGSWYSPNVKINVANTVGAWLLLNCSLKADFEANSLGAWTDVTGIRVYCAVLAADGPIVGCSGVADAYYDNVFVRKYVSPEPAHASWGSEETPPVGDTTAPTYSNISTNTTQAGQPCQFSVLWNDNVNVSGYIFGTNNTGVWVNDTWTSFTVYYNSTAAWSNVNKTLTSSVHVVVAWQVWCNDTSNNWNTTGLQYLTTTTTFQQQTDQPLTLQPAPARQTSSARVINQPLTFLLEVTRQTSYTRLFAQTFTILTETVRTLTLPRMSTQELNVLTTVARQTTFLRFLNQPLTAVATATRQINILRAADTKLSILTETSRNAAYSRLLTQPFSILTETIRTLTLSRTASQPLQLLLTTSRETSYSRLFNQPLQFIAESIRQTTYARTSNQILTILTEITRQASFNRLSIQPFTLLPESIRKTTYNRLFTQPFSILADAIRSIALQRNINQPFTLLIETTREASFLRFSAQTLEVLHSATRSLSNYRTANVLLQLSAQTTRQSVLNRLINQPLEMLISITRTASYHRTAEVLLQINTQTSIQISHIIERFAYQVLAIIPTALRQSTYGRTATQTFVTLIDVSRQLSLPRHATQILNFILTTARQTLLSRTALTQLLMLTQTSRQSSYTRTAFQALNILIESTRELSYQRSINIPFSIITEATRLTTATRTTNQILTILTETTRQSILQRLANQLLELLISATRMTFYHRATELLLQFQSQATIQITHVAVIQRFAYQTLTLLTEATRQSTLYRLVNQPLEMLVSAARQMFYHRTAEVLLQFSTQTSIKFIIYMVPTPAPAPAPVPVMPSIQLDAIIQTAHITSLWWQKTSTIEVLVINKGTLASDVTFQYQIIDQQNNIVTEGTQTIFISGLDKKTVYINIPTPPDGTYTVHFKTTSPVKVEAKTVTLIVETPFYGKLTFTILIILLAALAIYLMGKRRR